MRSVLFVRNYCNLLQFPDPFYYIKGYVNDSTKMLSNYA